MRGAAGEEGRLRHEVYNISTRPGAIFFMRMKTTYFVVWSYAIQASQLVLEESLYFGNFWARVLEDAYL